MSCAKVIKLRKTLSVALSVIVQKIVVGKRENFQQLEQAPKTTWGNESSIENKKSRQLKVIILLTGENSKQCTTSEFTSSCFYVHFQFGTIYIYITVARHRACHFPLYHCSGWFIRKCHKIQMNQKLKRFLPRARFMYVPQSVSVWHTKIKLWLTK